MAKRREYQNENRDFIRAQNKVWRKNNKATVNANRKLRKARKKQATPAWLTAEHKREMREMYLIAELLTKFLGEEHQVDHIIPLNHELVCGLHVPWNLQVLTAAENVAKSNRF